MAYLGLLRRCYSGAFLLITCALPSFGVSLIERTGSSELPAYLQLQLKCNVPCPYGYETDVEGNPICKCYNPCSNVFCFGRSKCKIKVEENCGWQTCKPVAVCEDIDGKGETLEQTKDPNSLTNSLMMDSGLNVCELPHSVEATECKKKRRRWYYDIAKRRCIKFKGCDVPGNNFQRKTLCKHECMPNRKSSRRKAGDKRKTKCGKRCMERRRSRRKRRKDTNPKSPR